MTILQLYRNAYTGLSRPAWLLAVVMLINRSGTMVLPYLSLYLTQHLHFSVRQAGIVLAVYGVGAVVGTYLGGRLTDRVGFYWIQFCSLFFGGVMLIVLQWVPRFEWLCVMVFVFTALGDSFRPANAAALAHYSTPETRTRAYSLNRLAINLGWAVGGGVGGVLASIDYRLLFWVDGLTCIAAATYLLVALPRPVRIVAASSDPTATVAEAVRSPWHDGLFLVFMGCVVAYTTAFMQFFSLVPLFLKQELGRSEAQIGLLNAFNGLLIVSVEMAFVYWAERRFGRKLGLAAVGVLLTGTGLLILMLPSLPALPWLWMLLFTVGEILAMPFMLAFAANRADDRNRGQYMGLYSMGWALAQVGSPFVGSQLAERFGFNVLWLCMAGSCALAAVGMLWLNSRIGDKDR